MIPAILPKSNKKTPWVRIIARVPGKSNVDVANVDSLDKVYRILTRHLQIKVGNQNLPYMEDFDEYSLSVLPSANVCRARGAVYVRRKSAKMLALV